MKLYHKTGVIFFILLLVFKLAGSSLKGLKIEKYPFFIYCENNNNDKYFIPSGWMGDKNSLEFNPVYKADVKDGKYCIEFKYKLKNNSNDVGWVGLYWLNPAENWGKFKSGYDLSEAKMLFFYARGEKGGEVIDVKIGGILGDYSDSYSAATGEIILTDKWKLYSLDLNRMDLSYINGGFCILFKQESNTNGCVIYLDNIYFHNSKKAVN